jgi:two-component system response regulator HydG
MVEDDLGEWLGGIEHDHHNSIDRAAASARHATIHRGAPRLLRSMLEHMERTGEATCEVCGLVPEAGRASSHVIVRSPRMTALMTRAARFAASDAPVVILGETGTGKEVVARSLHASSPRALRPFVAVNVAALPAELLESELFGHARGAFTGATAAKRGLFEEADGGVLFLDEIAELPLPLQAKLLRVLQDGEIRRIGETHTFAVDVRVVCATHRDLRDQVRRGAFREDLYFRLKVLTLSVPPLRERGDDIVPLARQFLAELAPALSGFTRAAEERLERHAWPGNVRELRNAVQHGAALARGPYVDVEDLPEDLGAAPAAAREALRSLADVEREHVLRVLDACGGSQADAARVLGIGRNTLWRKLRGYSANG